MCIGSTISARPGDKTGGAGRFDPALGCEGEAIEARLLSNPIEFDGIKIGIIELLPNAEIFDGITVGWRFKLFFE